MRNDIEFFPPMSQREALITNLISLPFIGVLLVVGATLGLFDLQTRLAYETDSRTVPGTVVEVVAGSPVVEFLPAERHSAPVITSARGTFERGADPDTEITYLVGDPSEAALGNGMWIPPILWGLLGLAVAIAVMLLHPNGPRANLYRIRQKGYRYGSTAKGETAHQEVRWRRWLGSGLLAASLALLAASWTVLLPDSDFLWPIFTGLAGAALLLPSINLLYRAVLYAALRTRPTTAPVRPRLFPHSWVMWFWIGFVVLILAALPVAFLVDNGPRNPQEDRARVTALGCTPVYSDRGCGGGVVIEYEVDGLPRTEWVLLDGHEVRVDQTVDIVWAERDPSHVRLVSPE